jgi:NitT/TauT family transport system substrate-binding protein
VDALIAGEVDAVTIWAPYSLDLIKRLGDTAAVFSDKAIYTSTLNLVAGEELLKQQPEVPRRVLAALLRANAFARSDSDRAARVLAQALELDEAVVKADWNPLNFTLELNQSFIISLEEQARWAIRRRLVEATAVPNFMEWIHTDALAAVKPNAVSVTE